MPQALALVLPAVFGTGGTIALTTAAGGLTLAGSIVGVAGSLALNYGLSKLTQQRPPEVDPANIKLTIQQAISPRVMHVGERLSGGTMVFFRAKSGKFYRVIVHGHGEIDSIVGYWLNKKLVTLDGSNMVNEGYTRNSVKRVQILTRPGAALSAYYSEIEAIWSQYDSTHRLNGLWTSLTIAQQIDAENMQKMYPNGEPPLAIHAKTAKLYDPRTDTTVYNDNAALAIAHLIEHPDVFNRAGFVDYDVLTTAANDADDAIPLAAGGTEPRARLWGSWSLEEPPAQVLQMMLQNCAGDVKLLPNGKIGVYIGKDRTPDVTLQASELLEIQSWTNGPDQIDRYTELPWTYVDPALNFTETSGETWVDATRETENGEAAVGREANFGFSPSSTQGDRMAKQKIEIDNPRHIIVTRWKPSARRALYERFINLNVPELPSTRWRVQSYSLSLVDGSVTLVLHAFDEASQAWTTGEEGTPFVPPAADTDTGTDIPAPTGVSAAGSGVQSSVNSAVAGITVSWDAPALDAYSPTVQYKVDGGSNWTTVAVAHDAVSVQISPLIDGEDYVPRVAFIGSRGTLGDWVEHAAVTATADTTPPAPPTGLTVTDLTGGDAEISLTIAASDTLWRTIVYRDAVAIHTITGRHGETVTFTDSPTAGSYDWTATSFNISNLPSTTDAGPVTETIT